MRQNNKWVSRNVSNISISAIKEMAMRSAQTEGSVSLAWGLPSFRTPNGIRQAVKDGLDADPDIGKYALPDGLPELRRQIAKTHDEATGVSVDPDANVIVTAGNMQGLNALLHTIVDPGDEIIVTDPGFASHFQQIRLCGGQPLFWKLDEAKGWRLDLDSLESLITQRTKAMILVTPSNPTGKIFSEQELRRVGHIAVKYDILILLDDPYCHFTYENSDKYFNLSSVPELLEHVIYLFTFSKTHAMSGWRLGYIILPEQLKPQVLKVHDATLICAPRISQVAGLAALKEDPAHLLEHEEILGRRRELICERLDRMSHVFQYVKPEGAYYVFPKIVADHQSSIEFANRVLDEAKVAVTPGSAFGPSGEHHVRMAYCVDETSIETAFDRLEAHFGVE